MQMIRRRTAIVLGAGASHDYGFPLGRSLLKLVCDHLQSSFQSTKVLAEIGFPIEDQKRFAEALEWSGLPSVDAFLERRTEFMDIGKAAIAAELIPCENPSTL